MLAIISLFMFMFGCSYPQGPSRNTPINSNSPVARPAEKKAFISSMKDEYLIELSKENLNSIPEILAEFGLEVRSRTENFVVVQKHGKLPKRQAVNHIQGDSSFRNFLELIKSHKKVYRASFNVVYELEGSSYRARASNCTVPLAQLEPTVPNDTFLKDQWWLRGRISCPPGVSSCSPIQGANVFNAWGLVNGSSHVKIGIVDQGLGLTSGEIPYNGQLCASRCYRFVDSITEEVQTIVPAPFIGHLMNVTSLAATCSNNAQGYASPNWRSPTTALRLTGITQSNGKSGLSIDEILPALGIMAGIRPLQAANIPTEFLDGVDVINTSFGHALKLPNDAHPYFSFAERIQRRKNIVWVASAGNESSNADLHFPSAIPSIISVGATDRGGALAEFSNYGSKVDILAPGDGLKVYLGDHNAAFISGTSFSAPLVSSIVSLVKEAYLGSASTAASWNYKVARYFLQKFSTTLTCQQLCPEVFSSSGQFEVESLGEPPVIVSFNPNLAACRASWCDLTNPLIPPPPGMVNAEASVIEARKGLPAVPLIDTDMYLVSLTKDSTFFFDSDPIFPEALREEESVVLHNVGGAAGMVTLIPSNSNIEVRTHSGQYGAQVSLEIAPNERQRIWVRVVDKHVIPKFNRLIMKTDSDLSSPNSVPHTDWHSIFVEW